jgi:succinoglycan biosynthesis protein ExoM
VPSGPSPDTRLRLTIAVLTYRRPGDIAEILPLLVEQAQRATTDGLITGILVIDNDPTGGAQEAVEAFAVSAPITVGYANETAPGISAARNRALETSAASDLLVFIDDDERPTEGWLAALLSTWRTTSSIAVVGPVVSTFEIEPEPWITAGRFFVRKRHPTGTVVPVAATNNLLLDLRFVRLHGIHFDLAFGISGGDDTMFTKELTRAGGTIVWCDESVVLDVVPKQRISRRWVTLRAMSSGNSWSITSVKLETSARRRFVTRLKLTAKGGVRLLGGAARFGAGVLTRRMDQRARGVRTLARGTGMVGGAWGYKYLEYRRPNS